MTFLLLQVLTGLAGASALFLVAAGLTVIFGVTRIVNFSHGSLYMLGAYFAAATANATGSFVVGVVVALAATALAGAVLERLLLKRFYARTHLDQVLVTFGLILVFNEIVRLIWGPTPLNFAIPAALAYSVQRYRPTFVFEDSAAWPKDVTDNYAAVVRVKFGSGGDPYILWKRARYCNCQGDTVFDLR